MKTKTKKTAPKKTTKVKATKAKTKKISISTDTAELAWMEHYAKKHELTLSYLFTSAARLFRHFTVDQPLRVSAAMKGCGNPSHYSEVPADAVELRAVPLPTPGADSWELTEDERGAFCLVGLYVPKTDDPQCLARLEELLTEHETRAFFRRACEKLLARADSRQVTTSPERELAYLKERIHEAKNWLRLGMTAQLWGSISDGYAALDNGRVPPVKTWQAEMKNAVPDRRCTCGTSNSHLHAADCDLYEPVTRVVVQSSRAEMHERLERHFMENLSPLWPDDQDPLASKKALNLVCSYLLGITTPPLDLSAIVGATPPSKFSPDFSEGGGVEKQAPLPPSVFRGPPEGDPTRDELKKPLGRGGME
jgi:hypothetical protein